MGQNNDPWRAMLRFSPRTNTNNMYLKLMQAHRDQQGILYSN